MNIKLIDQIQKILKARLMLSEFLPIRSVVKETGLKVGCVLSMCETMCKNGDRDYNKWKASGYIRSEL